MNSFLASQIKEITSEGILHELETDGNALATARRMREEIKAGWLAGLKASGMPDTEIAKLAF